MEREMKRKEMKIKKRGAIEVQFNWIFVLVAGAIILLFFITVSQKAAKSSKVRIADDILDQFSLAISGAKVSTGTANLIETPKMGFEFSCDSSSCNQFGCTSGYTVRGTGIEGRQTKIHPVFAPNIVKGNYIVTWIVDWNIPYRIGNFVYVTSPEVKYYLVIDENIQGSKEFILELNRTLPDKELRTGEATRTLLNKEIVYAKDLNRIVYQNNYKTIFVYYEGDIYTLHSSFKGTDNQHISIKPKKEGIDGYGVIEFMKPPYTSRTRAFYAGRASLFGAIFAEDADYYDCNMKKAMLMYNIIGRVYSEKARILYNYYCNTQGIGGVCQKNNAE